jgi:predicted transcriptional regulator of viral defense system
MARTHREQVVSKFRREGVLRPRDLAEAGVPRTILRRMVAEGILANPERGLYVLADAKPNLHQSLIEACKRVPHGIVCLLSALQFHGLTTQAPFEVWMAIAESARRPSVAHPPLRIVRFSGVSLTSGVEERVIDGARVCVTTPAKTVADCFKYRNKIGLDVALEALRDCRRTKRATMDDLHRAAVVCRMTRVMRPYLESLS